MVLGKVGPHDSIFIIDEGEAVKTVNIRNTCLSVVHCHMSTKDKYYIKELICSTFSLEELKEAREVLFTSCEPSKKYDYRGPRSPATDRDKILDAFEGIYTRMVKLDAQNSMPKFSVPSEDLMRLFNTRNDNHFRCNEQFSQVNTELNKVNKELSEFKATFHNVVAVLTSTNQPSFPNVASTGSMTGVPPGVRQRLLSTGSKRSASEFSDDEDTPHSGTDVEQGFELPRNQRRKAAKKVRVNTPPQDKRKYSEVTKTNAKDKPPPTWGTAKVTSSFKGAVSDLFLYNCDITVTTQDVVDYYKANNIELRNVEKLSHKEAARTSFKLSSASQEDCDKILSGEILPEGIAVRKFIPRKFNPTSTSQALHKKSSNQFRPTNSGNTNISSRLDEAAMQLDNILQTSEETNPTDP